MAQPDPAPAAWPRRKWGIVGTILVLALLAGGYAAYWHYVAGRLQVGIADWAQQQRQLGAEIAFTDAPISGFPLAFRTTFRAVVLGFPQPGGMLRLTGDAFEASLAPWDLQDIHVTSLTPAQFSLQQSEALQRLTLAQGGARIRLSEGRLHVLSIASEQTTLELATGTYVAAKAAAEIELPAAPPADYHQPLLHFYLSLADLVLPASQRAVTAGPIGLVSAKGAVMGPTRPFVTLQDGIRDWANAGGTVELTSLDFAQGPLTVAGSGTVTLDETLQPLGALTIRARGLPETIDLLKADGMLDDRAAATGSMMAKNLARPDDQGRPTVNVSLSLQQGYLWLGPVKLARLPVLNW